MDKHTIDLTLRPPRSPRTRLGGYVLLPRMIDKGRATLAGKNGEYNYDCPLDHQFVSFAGIDAGKLKEQLAAGKGDGEILEWISASATHKASPWEIQAWSAFQEQRVPMDIETRTFLQEYQSKAAPGRKDVGTWFDLLDIDDFVTFGGKA
jgi:hypothetical protein